MVIVFLEGYVDDAPSYTTCADANEGSTLRVVPPSGAAAPSKYWIDVPKTYVGNAATPKEI
jgi:hypothetical protein